MVNGDPNADAFSISMQFEAVNKIFEDMLINYDYLFKDIESEVCFKDTERFCYDCVNKRFIKTSITNPRILSRELSY